jgi:alpha-glucosidase
MSIRHPQLVLLLAVALPALGTAQQPLEVRSPDGQLRFSLTVPEKGQLTYAVSFRDQAVIEPSALGLDLENQPLLGQNLHVVSTDHGEQDETYEIPAGKSNPVRNHYNWLKVELEEQDGFLRRRLTVEARAYDDGVAFRYLLPEQSPPQPLRLRGEVTEFRIAKDATAYPMTVPNMQTSQEWENDIRPLSSLLPGSLMGLPLLMDVPGAGWIAITEAHIENYAGMYLTPKSGRNNAGTLAVKLSPRVDDPEVAVIGVTPLASPWRVIMAASDPGRLIESNLIINLNPSSVIQDTSWIRAGKCAWNWWSNNVVDNQPFQGGMNTATMKYYIDFAAESGFEYMLIDAGWSAGGRGQPTDITKTDPDIDMPDILTHAKSKNVKVWLWLHWTATDRQMEEAFALYEKWGIAGVKVDFMDRDDQWMVDFYHRVVKTAAAHHLMVDFHGAYKPDGLRRTYPNLMTREGVLGMEFSKWSARSNPEQHVTIPFTRMLAGPMDFTPGGFNNVTYDQFESRQTAPMVMGTRAHHLAMYVVYESPAQMVSDHPGAYRDQPSFSFLKAVPATWDETRVVNGRVGDYVTIARRRGKEWFAGSMTDWTGRDLEISLSFLGGGEYVADIYADAPEAGTDPKRVAIERDKAVNRSTTLKARLAPGGGYAVYIRPRP